MTLSIAPGLLMAFLFVLVRAAAWVSFCPPFNNGSIPSVAKVGIAGGIAVALAPHVAATAQFSADLSSTPVFIWTVVEQAVVGVVLGVVVNALFLAITSAGGMIDLVTGLNLTAAMDPLSLEQQPVIGRLYSLVATTLLFASDGYLLLIKGFMTSYQGAPVTGLRFESVTSVLLDEVGLLFLSTLEIAAPLMAVMFLTDLVLGLLARAAPQMNILALAASVKVLIGITLVGVTLPLMPGEVSNLIDLGIRNGLGLVGA